LHSIDPRTGIIVLPIRETNYKNARVINFNETAFDIAIFNHHIRPSETVQGWIFLETIDTTPDDPLEFGIDVIDSIKSKGSQNGLSTNAGDGRDMLGQAAIMSPTDTIMDISQMSLAFYSDDKPVMPPSPTPGKGVPPTEPTS
jgi:hypothetical protein